MKSLKRRTIIGNTGEGSAANHSNRRAIPDILPNMGESIMSASPEAGEGIVLSRPSAGESLLPARPSVGESTMLQALSVPDG